MKATNSGRTKHYSTWYFAPKVEATAKFSTDGERCTRIWIWFVKRDVPSLRSPQLGRQAPSGVSPVSVVIDCLQSLWLMPFSHRDMHGLTLQAINPILAFAGFPPINRIQDFNLVGFKQQCLQLEASNKAKTAKQHIFLRYLHTCRKRIHNGVPVNHNPEAKVCVESLKKNTDTNSIII